MSILKRMGNPASLNQGESTLSARKSQEGEGKSGLSSKLKRNLDPLTEKMQPEEKNIQELLRKKVVQELKELSLEKPELTENEDLLIGEIERIAENILEKDQPFMARVEQKKQIEQVVDIVTGYGPISPLIADADITEIMVNGPSHIYIEKAGKLTLTPFRFGNTEQLMHVISRIVSPLGRRIDESSPMVDARLPDGSRVNVIIPPLSLKGPVLTIRKFSEEPFTVEDLINFGTLTPEIALFIKSCVEAKVNIFISGGTGSGKTTTLNVLSAFIPGDERIVTIEDAAELKLWQEHVVTLETRTKNAEGVGEVSMRDLVRNSLRMRPDRIVVGEVRGGEALDMLQAMNTGHDGSLTTGHANSPRDMLSRIETMVLMAGVDIPMRAIREQISSAIDIIVQQSRMKDGTRKITSIVELTGMEGEVIVMQELFRFVQEGFDAQGKILGRLQPTGIVPRFYERFALYGVQVPRSIFLE